MGERPLQARARLSLRHATDVVPVFVTGIESLVDIHTFADQLAPAHLALNDIGKVRLKTTRPIAFDSYVDERATGAFVLVS